MPYYADMRPRSSRLAPDWAADEKTRRRPAERLLKPRQALAAGEQAIPSRRLDTLVLATWNLREFDSELGVAAARELRLHRRGARPL